MTRPCILAITVGRSDIKIRLQNENGNSDVYEIRRKSTRQFHNLLRHTLVNEPLRLQYDQHTKGPQGNKTARSTEMLEADCTQDGAFHAKEGRLQLPAGMLELSFPKLVAPVAILAQEQSHQLGLIVGAIVYYTDRDTPQDNEEEPFAAGEIVQHWLAKQLGLNIAAQDDTWQTGAVCRINYAQGKAEIEGAGRDYPIYRSICARLEAPLRQAHAEFPEARLDLCTLGGMKSVNNVLYASACMFFADVRQLNTSERHIAPQEIAFADQSLGAEEDYRLRGQAIALLRRGHFSAAYTLVTTRLNATASEHAPWLQTLQLVHHLLQGQWRPSAYPHAGRLQERLLADDVYYCPRTLVLLLRVDAALHQEQLPTAMHLSLALPQAALLDGIALFLQRQMQQERLQNPKERYWAIAEEANCINAEKQRLELHHVRNPALRKRIYNSLIKAVGQANPTTKADECLPETTWSLDDLWENWPQPYEYSANGQKWLTCIDQFTDLNEDLAQKSVPLKPVLDALCKALQQNAQVLHTHTLHYSAQAWSDPRKTAPDSALAKPWVQAGIWEQAPTTGTTRSTWRLARSLVQPVLQALGYRQEPPSIAELLEICSAPLYASVMA